MERELEIRPAVGSLEAIAFAGFPDFCNPAKRFGPSHYAVRRTTISISKDMVKHHIQTQCARHVAQLKTVASKDEGGKLFAPQTFSGDEKCFYWGGLNYSITENSITRRRPEG